MRSAGAPQWQLLPRRGRGTPLDPGVQEGQKEIRKSGLLGACPAPPPQLALLLDQDLEPGTSRNVHTLGSPGTSSGHPVRAQWLSLDSGAVGTLNRAHGHTGPLGPSGADRGPEGPRNGCGTHSLQGCVNGGASGYLCHLQCLLCQQPGTHLLCPGPTGQPCTLAPHSPATSPHAPHSTPLCSHRWPKSRTRHAYTPESQ